MIIFALGGTLANCEHRRHFVDPKKHFEKIGPLVGDDKAITWKPNWKAFYEACDQDAPIDPVIRMFNSLILLDHTIEIWSGRCESVREKTLTWLADWTFYNPEYPVKLRMRPIGDSTPDDVLKERWLDEAIAKDEVVEFVFDDRPKVRRMWQRRGIFVFNCCQHDEEF